MSQARVIVISGEVAAGKTTAAKLLRSQGFQYALISQAIRTRWDGSFGEKPPRSWYQDMGMQLHREIGQWALCQETLDLIPDPSVDFVIDGARWHEDISFFRTQFGSDMLHIHLVASADVRKMRFDAREKDVSFEEADADEVELEVKELNLNADMVFDNSTNDLSKLEEFINFVMKKV
jgi:dephospho-CoA kinase